MRDPVAFAKLNKETAEEVAIVALGALAQDTEALSRFLSLSGIEAGDIRQAAASPGFLAGVLDYLMQHEALLLSVSENYRLPAEQITAAHRVLSQATE